MINVLCNCPFCGKKYSVKVPTDAYNYWRNNNIPIQKAMPMVYPETRECLISGICISCQNDMFSDIEDEDADACERESLDFTGQWW